MSIVKLAMTTFSNANCSLLIDHFALILFSLLCDSANDQCKLQNNHCKVNNDYFSFIDLSQC